MFSTPAGTGPGPGPGTGPFGLFQVHNELLELRQASLDGGSVQEFSVKHTATAFVLIS